VEGLPMTATSPFHSNMRILWCEGRDLATGEPVFVPYELVHTDYSWPLPPGSGCFAATSNGLASGNHYLEAVSHGICELVERDAGTLWRLRRPEEQQARSVDLKTVDDVACRQVLERFGRAGVAVAVWETTTDVGIASFLCLIFQPVDDPARPLPPAAGAGCHPSRGIALLRALTEAAQTRLVQISGARDDLPRYMYARHRHEAKLDMLRAGLGAAKPHSFLDAPDWDSDTLDGDVDWELTQLQTAGLRQVIAVDLIKEFFGLPVVRVIIPRLEGIHSVPGYVPGARARAMAASRA